MDETPSFLHIPPPSIYENLFRLWMISFNFSHEGFYRSPKACGMFLAVRKLLNRSSQGYSLEPLQKEKKRKKDKKEENQHELVRT